MIRTFAVLAAIAWAAAQVLSAAPGVAQADLDRERCLSVASDRPDAWANIDNVIAACGNLIQHGASEVQNAGFGLRALAYMEKGQFERALQDAEEMGRRNPGQAHLFIVGGIIQVAKGDYNEGVRDLDRAIRMQPKEITSLRWRCLAQAMTGRLEAALFDCEDAIKNGLLRDTGELLDARAFVHLKAGRFDQAIADYNIAFRVDPHRGSSLYGRGIAKQRRGDSAGSEYDIAAALALSPHAATDLARFKLRAPDDSDRLTRVTAPEHRQRLIDDCDRLAADPDDRERPAWVRGLSIGGLTVFGDDREERPLLPKPLDATLAVPACALAVKAAPDVRRLAYQLARALLAAWDQRFPRNAYRPWLEAAANAGHTEAMRRLGSELSEKDPTQARRWYEKMVAAGDPGGMTSIGSMFMYGSGASKDPKEGRQWYEKAAAAGDSTAMYYLGLMFEEGESVRKDLAQARQWFEKAAAAGSSGAPDKLGEYYKEGKGGVKKNLVQARIWFQMGAVLGDSGADYNLHKMDQTLQTMAPPP